MAIRIVTDSVSDLPSSVARVNDITVVPLYVIIGSETYKDGVEIDADRFYSRLVELSNLPSTSQPSVADFQEVHQRLLDQGHQIVSIHASSKLSVTFNSATQARESLDAASQIEIVDSQLAGGAQALLALSGAGWAREMSDSREVARRVRQAIPRNHVFILVDTLKYLEKGGRIGKAQAFLGGMLNFKPIISIRDGVAHPVERSRTRDGEDADCRDSAPVGPHQPDTRELHELQHGPGPCLSHLRRLGRLGRAGAPYRVPVWPRSGHSSRPQHHRRGGNPGKRCRVRVIPLRKPLTKPSSWTTSLRDYATIHGLVQSIPNLESCYGRAHIRQG